MPTFEQVVELWNASNNIQKLAMLVLIGENHNDTREVKDYKRNLIRRFYRSYANETIAILKTDEIAKENKKHTELMYKLGNDYQKFKDNQREEFLKTNPQYQVLVF